MPFPFRAGRPPGVLPLALTCTLLLGACSAPSSPATLQPHTPGTAATVSTQATRSAKRGVAYDLASTADATALSPGVGWWYNWSPTPNPGATGTGMEFVPMLWNGTFDTATAETQIRALGTPKNLLVLNEPNLTDQANLTPAQAAALWPRYEQVARDTGVNLVGPAMTWGTMPNYQDPVAWLDAFYAAYRNANGGRDPRIDALAFHWYDYGLAAQLDRLKKYGKPLWVTEFANWHAQQDGAQIDTPARQLAQQNDMVATLEGRSDVLRYAWFTGRWPNDTHATSLLAGSGQLTPLGQNYLNLPAAPAPCGTTNIALNRPATASTTENAGTPASAAVDGNAGTRWSSAFADPQWLQVDLGSVQPLCQVTLNWERPPGRPSRSRRRTTPPPGRRCTAPPAARAACRPSPSRAAAATSACTARSAPPRTGTRCGR